MLQSRCNDRYAGRGVTDYVTFGNAGIKLKLVHSPGTFIVIKGN